MSSKNPASVVGKGMVAGLAVGLVWLAAGAVLAPAAFCAVDVSALVPPRMEAPLPDGLLKFFQLITFYIHLLLVNVVLGSVILALLDRKDTAADEKKNFYFMPKSLALAVNFGIAPFLFLQVVYGSFLYPTVVLMAVWWISIIFAIMLAYYGLYVCGGVTARRGPVLPLTALMLLIAAFVLTNMSSLMIRPDRWTLWFSDPHGTILNLTDPGLFPRYLHMLVGSTAVGGLTLAWRARWRLRYPRSDVAQAERNIRHGLSWYFYATIAQGAVGLLFLFSLPGPVRGLFLGGSALHTIAILLVISGLGLALYQSWRGDLARTTAIAAGIILLMVGVRDLVRDASLEAYLELSARNPVPLAMPDGQGLAFALFIICLGIGVAGLVWLLRVLLRTYDQAGTSGAGEE